MPEYPQEGVLRRGEKNSRGKEHALENGDRR